MTAIATATVDHDDCQKPAVVVCCRQRQWRSSWTAAAVDGGGNDVFATAVNGDDRMVANRPSLPPPSPPPPPPLMLPPPRPCPCLRLANIIAPPTLLLMVGCCVVCRPSPAASSAVQICQSPPSCGASSMLFPLVRHPLLLSIASRCLLLFYREKIAFAAPIEGWLLGSPPAQPHTDNITKLKTFPVSTSWTYFDLLRVSTCERMLNLRGCQFFLSSCVVTTSSILIPTYM